MAAPSECSDLDAAQLVESSRKRARIEVPPFHQINLAQFLLKDNGKNKYGGKSIFPLIGNAPIRFDLTPNDWLVTPFGMSLTGLYENPSFLSGKEPEKLGKSEHLSIKVNLAAPQTAFLKELDKAACEAFAKLAKVSWHPLVSDNETAACKINVVLKGDVALTKLIIVNDGKVLRGEGWEFLKKEGYVNGLCAFKRAEVKLTVKVRGLWNMNGKAGLTLEATQLVLRICEPVEANYDNDEELLK